MSNLNLEDNLSDRDIWLFHVTPQGLSTKMADIEKDFKDKDEQLRQKYSTIFSIATRFEKGIFYPSLEKESAKELDKLISADKDIERKYVTARKIGDVASKSNNISDVCKDHKSQILELAFFATKRNLTNPLGLLYLLGKAVTSGIYTAMKRQP